MEPCPKYGIEIVAYMSKKKKKKTWHHLFLFYKMIDTALVL